ncbi:MAG: hypothetical protein HY710_13155 [Candidatus Latescibacteria bacterium]|nr:hypothetical protein [Candidatus Latescibacterota bacterium]
MPTTRIAHHHGAPTLFILFGQHITPVLDHDLNLTLSSSDGRRLWESSRSHPPTFAVVAGDGARQTLPLSSAKEISVTDFAEGAYHGHTVRLSGYPGANLALELTLAIDPRSDELLIQTAQTHGPDTVVRIDHCYRFEKPILDGGYMVLPHGSGYLIPAACPDELPGQGLQGGLIGARWTLPLFGMVRGRDALCIIVETWWDCDVAALHRPGDGSALDFSWLDSLGTLDYPRRFLLRCAEGLDYVGMAKLYREYAGQRGLLCPLAEKAEQTPIITRYIQNILVRWPAWSPSDAETVLTDLRRLRTMGFGINFFFPKWSSSGYAPERATATTANAGWQAFLHPNPVPGGWSALVEYARAIHELGCTVQGFINPRTQVPDGPAFDETRWPHDADGHPIHDLSVHDAVDRIQRVLDHVEGQRLQLDVLYYDGYSAHLGLPPDHSPAHPVTRRQTFEGQNACFAETRQRGIMPGGELARFWCMADCDYFFFTDWSNDRLVNTPNQGAPAPVGEPIPLFQLVFHDCCIAGFSGGGYRLYAPGYDWWPDRTPRLYELLFASAPAHNWLPDGYVPVRDWDSPAARQRWRWLKRWSAYYSTIAMAEMVSHRFLSADSTQQRVEFANGVIAEFNRVSNQFRVIGVPGFSGDWERPDLEGNG